MLQRSASDFVEELSGRNPGKAYLRRIQVGKAVTVVQSHDQVRLPVQHVLTPQLGFSSKQHPMSSGRSTGRRYQNRAVTWFGQLGSGIEELRVAVYTDRQLEQETRLTVEECQGLSIIRLAEMQGYLVWRGTI